MENEEKRIGARRSLPDFSSGEVSRRIEQGLVNVTKDSAEKTTGPVASESNLLTYFNLIFLLIAVVLCLVGSIQVSDVPAAGDRKQSDRHRAGAARKADPQQNEPSERAACRCAAKRRPAEGQRRGAGAGRRDPAFRGRPDLCGRGGSYREAYRSTKRF